MTERKPAGITVESWVERQIREATERGELDDLPGSGQPLTGLRHTGGEAWWIKERAQREGISTAELLPTPLRLRKQVEQLPEEVRDLPDEHSVRAVVQDLNQRIAAWLRNPSGPRVGLAPVNADEVVRHWRAERTMPVTAGREMPRVRAEPAARRGWWHRLWSTVRGDPMTSAPGRGAGT